MGGGQEEVASLSRKFLAVSALIWAASSSFSWISTEVWISLGFKITFPSGALVSELASAPNRQWHRSGMSRCLSAGPVCGSDTLGRGAELPLIPVFSSAVDEKINGFQNEDPFYILEIVERNVRNGRYERASQARGRGTQGILFTKTLQQHHAQITECVLTYFAKPSVLRDLIIFVTLAL